MPFHRLFSLFATVGLLFSCVLAVHAHDNDGHYRIGGDKIVANYGGPGAAGKKNKFLFKTKGEPNLATLPNNVNPLTQASKLVVVGSGDAAADTGVLELDMSKWSVKGNGTWLFKGNKKDPMDHGIKKIVFRRGDAEKGGSLLILAKGPNWPLAIDGPQDSLSVLLYVDVNTVCAEFSETTNPSMKRNGGGLFSSSGAGLPFDCPGFCGNGIVEIPEDCDDGNNLDGDSCQTDCTTCAGTEYASTFEGIQERIFDGYQCSTPICHGADTQSGGLDLREGLSYDALVNVASQIAPSTLRVFPGDQDLSLLYQKIREKTLGDIDVPGGPMPANEQTVTEDHLEALRLWIRGGAPRDGVVEGTADKLGTCLPPASPKKIPQPQAPAADEGLQVAMPGYDLPAQSETELCVASYYDVSAIVPEEFLINCPGRFPGTNEEGLNAGKCFAYSADNLYQDAQSHHSIVHIYAGEYDWDEGSGAREWGPWTCYYSDDAHENDGESCVPNTADPCPGGGVCGGPTSEGVACLAIPGFGPPDASTFGDKLPTWSGSQESIALSNLPGGVYRILPLKGIIVWNSHAFNLTQEDMNMEAWINVEFTSNLLYPYRGIFNADHIFIQDVPPFETREYCYTHTLPRGANLFRLSSHAHKGLRRWRYFAPPQDPCSHPDVCSPGDPSNLFHGYESYDYSDALQLDFDPPLVFDSEDEEDRTLKFCALYDNGATDPTEVKRQSTAPETPIELGTLIPGGPCSDEEVKCLGGPNVGQLCGGMDSNCPGSVCDACNRVGGVTTEDEMFIALGGFFLP